MYKLDSFYLLNYKNVSLIHVGNILIYLLFFHRGNCYLFHSMSRNVSYAKTAVSSFFFHDTKVKLRTSFKSHKQLKKLARLEVNSMSLFLRASSRSSIQTVLRVIACGLMREKIGTECRPWSENRVRSLRSAIGLLEIAEARLEKA